MHLCACAAIAKTVSSRFGTVSSFQFVSPFFRRDVSFFTSLKNRKRSSILHPQLQLALHKRLLSQKVRQATTSPLTSLSPSLFISCLTALMIRYFFLAKYHNMTSDTANLLLAEAEELKSRGNDAFRKVR